MIDHLRADGLQRPRPDRFGPTHRGFVSAMAAHTEAVAAAQPGYIDPASGLFVLTAAYLAARGDCCDSGCRHCPYATANP